MFFDWQSLPMEMQVRTLSYLRAVDLSAVQQTNRYFWQNKTLQHAIVVYCAEQVYPKNLTAGFAAQPTTTEYPPATTSSSTMETTPKGKGSSNSSKKVAQGRKNRSSSLGSVEDAAGVTTHKTPSSRDKSRSASMGSVEDTTENSESSSPSTMSEGFTTTLVAATTLYTFEHLRNMELLVVVRVLNSPEPTTGFVVSKSWCKTALRWLEGQQERMQQHNSQQLEMNNAAGSNRKNKKKTRKQRLKERKNMHSSSSHSSSTVSIPPPPANVNSDITCEHDQLQHYTSIRSARARRRLLDKQAWKILKVLYPESTTLPATGGECLQCRAEACQVQKHLADQQEAARQERKLPLQNPAVRRFYTRTRGVPEHCLRKNQTMTTTTTNVEVAERNKDSVYLNACQESNILGPLEHDANDDDDDRKLPAREMYLPEADAKVSTNHCQTVSLGQSMCPFVDGTYYVLPRSWCHGWRRFMKTGEGGMSPTKYSPPDATCLLCDAHRMALLPPHLEAFLAGESSQLLEATGTWPSQASVEPASLPASPPGLAPVEALVAMHSLGLTEAEISQQLAALRSIEAQRLWQQRQVANNGVEIADFESNNVSRNTLLDRENHSVVEILTKDEFRALEACWSGLTAFALRFTVRQQRQQQQGTKFQQDETEEDDDDTFVHCGANFCTPVCASCDATGRRCSVSVKNRARGWVKKSAEKTRAPASLEY